MLRDKLLQPSISYLILRGWHSRYLQLALWA